MGIKHDAAAIAFARRRAGGHLFAPNSTVKLQGRKFFRSQTARDLACLFDMNHAISSWVCMPTTLQVNGAPYIPDFAVFNDTNDVTLVDAGDRSDPDGEVQVASERSGWRYRLFDRDEIYDGFRLRNARDLLRYGEYTTPLGDRVRLLAALDEHGTLTVADSLSVFREGNPMAALASMVLNDFVEIELDDALIGPETTVRRIA
ncbi:hypothetical protein [Rhizobium sp. 18055]|uniref:hypothetical protein n=1 Tax=Rhizobium sp. 18055 TaxID=2681403 RepID=UPI00135B86AF|nr:hypothetical protein [Rhizobium sp. 18055]